MGFHSLWELFIRPSRQVYSISDLGNELQKHGVFRSRRTDFVLLNKQQQKLQCSLFEPMFQNQVEPLQKYPCVVYCHCNSGSRLEALHILSAIIERGMALFCFDFAGSGLSDGQFVTLGLNESLDLECVVAHLLESPRVLNIALWGRSLGAATCMMYAGKRLGQRGIKAIVFDSGFSNIRMLALGFAKQRTGFPNILIESVISLVSDQVKERVPHLDIHNIDLAQVIHTIYVPCQFVTSKQDTFVKSEQVEQLYSRYNGQKWIQYINGEHNGPRTNETLDSLASWVSQMIYDKQYIAGSDLLQRNTENNIQINNVASPPKVQIHVLSQQSRSSVERFSSPIRLKSQGQSQMLGQQNVCELVPQTLRGSSAVSHQLSPKPIGITRISVANNLGVGTRDSAPRHFFSSTQAETNPTRQSTIVQGQQKNEGSEKNPLMNEKYPLAASVKRKSTQIGEKQQILFVDSISSSQSKAPTEDTTSRLDLTEGIPVTLSSLSNRFSFMSDPNYEEMSPYSSESGRFNWKSPILRCSNANSLTSLPASHLSDYQLLGDEQKRNIFDNKKSLNLFSCQMPTQYPPILLGPRTDLTGQIGNINQDKVVKSLRIQLLTSEEGQLQPADGILKQKKQLHILVPAESTKNYKSFKSPITPQNQVSHFHKRKRSSSFSSIQVSGQLNQLQGQSTNSYYQQNALNVKDLEQDKVVNQFKTNKDTSIEVCSTQLPSPARQLATDLSQSILSGISPIQFIPVSHLRAVESTSKSSIQQPSNLEKTSKPSKFYYIEEKSKVTASLKVPPIPKPIPTSQYLLALNSSRRVVTEINTTKRSHNRVENLEFISHAKDATSISYQQKSATQRAPQQQSSVDSENDKNIYTHYIKQQSCAISENPSAVQNSSSHFHVRVQQSSLNIYPQHKASSSSSNIETGKLNLKQQFVSLSSISSHLQTPKSISFKGSHTTKAETRNSTNTSFSQALTKR